VTEHDENAEDAAVNRYFAVLDGRDDAATMAGMFSVTADEPEPDAPDAEWRAVGDPRLPPQLHRR
jgi:hypothetical protein